MEIPSTQLETTRDTSRGVIVECVKDSGKLCVRVLSPGFKKSYNCQFPRNIRVEGAKYIVDDMAAWASRRAGQTIRMEDVPGQRVVARALGLLPGARRLHETLTHVSREVAEGNREVFAEVAPSFAGFVRAFRSGQPSLDDFFSAFKPGAAHRGGQDILRRAFERYHEAASMPWCKRKAELLHLGNLYVALQEQTRLPRRGHALFSLHGTEPTLFEEPITAAEWLRFTGRVRQRS